MIVGVNSVSDIFGYKKSEGVEKREPHCRNKYLGEKKKLCKQNLKDITTGQISTDRITYLNQIRNFFDELEARKSGTVIPGAEESSKFWSDICNCCLWYNENAE